MAEMSQREAYGRALADFGETNPNVVVLDADTSSSTFTNIFANRYPNRFFNIGIAEPCMVDFGVGLALGGYLPFVNAFAAFLSLRAIEQVRTCIAYAETNVKLVGHYAGVSDFKDGPTHNCIVDIGVMRSLPGMTVIVPADANEIRNWIPIIAKHVGPLYFRISRAETILVHSAEVLPQIGKAMLLRDGDDATIIAAGSMVGRSLMAAEKLSGIGISARVLEMHTIKPLDVEAICQSAEDTKAIVTAEEHSILCGLGSAVAEILAENCPTPMVRVGIMDKFARTSLNPDSLMDAYGMGVDDVVNGVKCVIEKKNRHH
jgi:transketolase